MSNLTFADALTAAGMLGTNARTHASIPGTRAERKIISTGMVSYPVGKKTLAYRVTVVELKRSVK